MAPPPPITSPSCRNLFVCRNSNFISCAGTAEQEWSKLRLVRGMKGSNDCFLDLGLCTWFGKSENYDKLNKASSVRKLYLIR